MARILFKAFLISVVFTLLVAVYAFAEGNAYVLAQETPTPFLPIGTLTPTAEAQVRETILVKVSHYWPPSGGPNCARFVNGRCLSEMASGERWQDWKGQAIACPPEFPFGTQFLIEGRVWICLDRGGAIQIENGIVWVDMLIKVPLYDYGEVVEATILPEQFVLDGTD